jgi:hypothetical protein
LILAVAAIVLFRPFMRNWQRVTRHA